MGAVLKLQGSTWVHRGLRDKGDARRPWDRMCSTRRVIGSVGISHLIENSYNTIEKPEVSTALLLFISHVSATYKIHLQSRAVLSRYLIYQKPSHNVWKKVKKKRLLSSHNRWLTPYRKATHWIMGESLWSHSPIRLLVSQRQLGPLHRSKPSSSEVYWRDSGNTYGNKNRKYRWASKPLESS